MGAALLDAQNVLRVVVAHIIHLYVKTVRSDTATPLPSKPASEMVSLVCPKCGTTKKSGKLSCCARDGAWFKNCGDAGDKKFDHTWVEGIEACKRKFWKAYVLRRALRDILQWHR